MARRLQSAPIRAFVGFNGGGKTLAAVEFVARPALLAGRDVYATFQIDHPKAHLLTSWRELVELEHATVILDEITAALPSRQSMSLPAQLARVLNQLRKVDVELAWTAPNWARADKLLREVTGYVTTCYGIFPDKYLRDDHGHKLRRDDGTRGHLRAPAYWRPNRLFRFVTYAAAEFDEFTLNTSRRMKPVQRQWYYRPRHQAHRMYRTLEGVELLDHLDDVGLCIACGGTRPRLRCICTPKPRVIRGASSSAEASPDYAPDLLELDVPELAAEGEGLGLPDQVDAATAGFPILPPDDDPEPEWIRAFWSDRT